MNSPLIRQTWTMSAVLINMFGQGLMVSFPSVLLPALNAEDSPIKVDLDTSSWLGSIIGISGIAGYLTASLLMETHGRRKSHFLFILPGILGWLLIYFSENITTLMIGRFLGGFSALGTVSLGAVIIGEYTDARYRGIFLYLKNATISLGALFTHFVGQFFHWKTMSLLAIIPLAIALIIIFTWPESPAWLLSKQRYEECEENFYWLRGKNPKSILELKDTIKAQKERMVKQKIKQSIINKIQSFLMKFIQIDFLKPLFIMILAAILFEFSGRHVFPAYAGQILSKLVGDTSQLHLYTLCFDIIIASSALFASVLVKLMKRRTLLFSTGFSAVAVLMLTCIYLFLSSKDVISKERPWIPSSLLVLYFVLANFGCMSIPLVLAGEIFPLAHRGVGSAVSGVWLSLCLMICLQLSPRMLVSLELYGLFGVYGTIMLVSLLVLYFIMPETKDKNLQEIENYLTHGKYTANVDSDDEKVDVRMIKNPDENY